MMRQWLLQDPVRRKQIQRTNEELRLWESDANSGAKYWQYEGMADAGAHDGPTVNHPVVTDSQQKKHDSIGLEPSHQDEDHEIITLDTLGLGARFF